MFRQVVVVAACLALLACKKKKTEQEVADDAATATEPVAKPTPTNPDPDPYFEPDPGGTATAVDAAPLPTAAISEVGTPVFVAANRSATAVTWTIDATELSFSPTVIGSRGESEDVSIAMASGGRSLSIATCRGLSKENGGGVNAHQRGDTVFIACFTRPDDNEPGKSWGVRVKWNKDKRLAEVAGNWSNAGPPAFDTMEFGEGESQP